MKNFKSGDKSKDRRDFTQRNFSGRESRKLSMHKVVCDECGKECQVPFKPTSGKPMYCSECFEKKGGRNSNKSRRRDSYRHNYNYRGRDSGRFRQNRIGDQSTTKLIEKIEILNSNLDKIISLLSSAGEKEKLQKSKKEKNQKPDSVKVDKLS